MGIGQKLWYLQNQHDSGNPFLFTEIKNRSQKKVLPISYPGIQPKYKSIVILILCLVENYGAIEGYPTAGCPHCWSPRAYWKQLEWLDSFSVATIDHKKMCIFGGGKRDLIIGKVRDPTDRLVRADQLFGPWISGQS